MIERINRKKYRVYAMDFETHNDEESIAKKETSIWLGVILDENSKIDDESVYSYNIVDFIERVENLAHIAPQDRKTNKRNTKNVCIYDYNLSFEWSFILPELLRRGFKYKEHIEDSDEYVFNTISTRSVSSVWLCNLKFGKKDGLIMFKDLAKIYGGGLRGVAKAFNLETQKGDIDYRENRLHRVPMYATKEEKEYCFKDVRIIIEILQKVHDIGDKNFFSSSSASTYAMKTLIKTGYPRSIKPYKEFRKEYPNLSAEENAFIRNSVGGGITYAPRLWQFKEINKDVLHIDMHQAHPTSAYTNFFPYGEGTYFTGKPPIEFTKTCCCRVKVSYDDVKLHSIIQLIGIDFVEDYELTIWDFEIPTMRKCYVNLRIEYIDGYSYRTRPLRWREYYNNNYKARAEAKKNKDAFHSMLYKLLNNSSYGKLLEKPHNEIYKNTIDEYGIITSDVIAKEAEDIAIEAKYTYLPVGSCIPARTRVRLVETALLFGWENVCYFDTDSIFIVINEDTMNIWNTIVNQKDELGGWGLEAIHNRSQFTAPKRYKTFTDGVTDIKAGGINFTAFKEQKAKEAKIDIDKYEIPFDEVNIVSSSWQVQRAYRVKGGTLIEFQTKTMSVQPKYEEIYKKNML